MVIIMNKEVKIDDSGLEFDFYRDSCPNAEPLVQSMMRSIYKKQPDVAPALLRLMFHDCFIQGCDASVLLDSPNSGNQSEKDTVPNQTLKGFDVIEKIKSKVEEECPATVSCADILVLAARDGILLGCDASVLLDSPNSGNQSEKDTVPNQTLKGFDVIEKIKSKVEEECPATVSCADILVLAARDGILLAGGPFYPLTTGRRDSFLSFPEIAASEIPSPSDDLSKTITLFASRGFNERETVSLLGAHNIGKVHCPFFRNRLHNHSGTGLPNPALDPGTLNLMRSRCDNSNDQTEEPSINMDSEGAPEPEFGTHYYKNLVQGKGILHADQQLMASEETARLVEIYASDGSLFQQKGMLLAGGPYYPLTTGRRDSLISFPEIAASEIPSPSDDLSKTNTLFASRGLNERETVSLLGLGHSNSIGIAMKSREGIVCVADSKVTVENDPNYNETTRKLHIFGDGVVLMILGNATQCALVLEYLGYAINLRAEKEKPPWTVEEIAIFCMVTMQETNGRDSCGPSSRVVVCGFKPEQKIYVVRSTDSEIQEVETYFIGGSGSVGLHPWGHFRLPSSPTLFSMVDAKVECTNAILRAITLHPQTCGPPVWMCEIRDDHVVGPYILDV